MKIIKRKVTYFIITAIAGVLLLVIGCLRGDNSMINSCGIALFAVSILKIVQLLRLTKNEERLQKYELMQNEERLILIATKSGHTMFSVSIMVEYLAILGLLIAEKESAALILCCVVALQTFGYLITYYLFSKKY